MGARESLNGRKNIHGTKKSKERREEPLGTMSYQTSSKRSPPFWLLIGARKLVFFWHQSEARTATTVWNWSGKTLSPGALLAVLYFSSFHVYFSARLDFPSSPLSAPGSPRMRWPRQLEKQKGSGPFLRFPKPLFQTEVECEAIDMKIIF